MNESGSQIAELIAEGNTLGEILGTLKGNYGEDSGDLDGDVIDLIEKFSEKQLIQISLPGVEKENSKSHD